jgi:hypothetical protein
MSLGQKWQIIALNPSKEQLDKYPTSGKKYHTNKCVMRFALTHFRIFINFVRHVDSLYNPN